LVIIKSESDKFKVDYPNVEYLLNNKSIFTLIKLYYKYNQIYLHSLFNSKILAILYTQPWLLKKTSWIIWGRDLYSYRQPKITIKSKVIELMRKKVIKNMGRLLPIVEGDYQLVKKWYKAKGTYKIARYNN